MTLERCYSAIDRYLNREDECAPRFVNVESVENMAAIVDHYKVGENIFLTVEKYSSDDENPRIADLLNDLATLHGNIFLTGFTTYWKLIGTKEISSQLKSIAQMSVEGHVVVLCFQCNDYLSFRDSRINRLVYNVDSAATPKPHIIFVSSMLQTANADLVDGIQNLPATIESTDGDILYVKTKHHPEEYPHALFRISEETNSYDALCRMDRSTEELNEDMGTDEQWAYALTLLQNHRDWVNAINHEIGLYSNLELFINASQDYPDEKKWLYFIALKRFGAKNECLNLAGQKAQAYEELAHWVVRGLVDLNCKSPDFWERYNCRKNLLNQVKVSDDEILDYCRYIRSKKRNALYYLTDSHRLEKELILECIADYSESYSRDELRSVLQHVYPDLYAYLMPYKFSVPLLNQYFEDYKFCKLENRITPEFYSLVEEQAVKREYNLFLPARSEKIESVDMSDALAYFMDAMGVEFLGYIAEKSKQKKLLPKFTVCRSELPSITSRNKEFLDVFAERNVQCKDIKLIDDIKHHGAENFTLENSPYPTHLIRELEIIDRVLDLIKLDIAKGKYAKVIMVSDHGASRLVVLKNQMIDGEFDVKGTHCGRVCAYTEQTGSMPMVVQDGENDEYAVVADYKRFKPGRLMGVEVHGGATLEEVTVPIIELSYVQRDIEIIVQTPLVTSSIRKPPVIEFYSTTKIDDIVVNVGNTEYKANSTDGHTFTIEMAKRTRANTYLADVYAEGTMIATGLEFRVEKEGFKSNDIL